MTSDTQLAALIQLGLDFYSFKFYVASMTALWIYDYLLTLEDEIRYAWKTESVLIFSLFLFCRYLPIIFQVWDLFVLFYPGYTAKACEKTAFLQIVYYVFMAAAAQIVLTQRAYAITRKNKWVAGFLYTISATQLSLGIYKIVWGLRNPVLTLPKIPLEAYHMCLTASREVITIAQITLSFSFDVAIFVVVIFQAQIFRRTHRGVNGQSILDVISKDALLYFIFITMCHLLIVIMYVTARSGIRTLPFVGIYVFLPMMICRMLMSLRKFTKSQRFYMNVELPTTHPSTNLQDSYPPDGTGGIQLTPLKK